MKQYKILQILFFVFIQNSLNATTKINFKDYINKYPDATDAFIAVSKKINELKNNVELFIPKGTYIVGRQYFQKGGKCYAPQNILDLKNCNNIKVYGETGTILNYKDNLKIGGFNPNDGSIPIDKNSTSIKAETMAEIGTAFFFEKCNNISISKVEINGNNTKIITGCQWGDHGYQCWHNGIFLYYTNNVKISNVNVHHMGLDGIYIANDSIPNNITILNSKFEFNARQAFSWAQGNGIKVSNCSFSYTGKGGFSSSPGAGIDIEPSSKQNICKNASFDNCKILFNMGLCISNDNSLSNNIKFTNCIIINTDYYSVLIKSPNYTFENCKIFGTLVEGYISSNWNESTKYIGCDFMDTIVNGKPSFGVYLAEISGVKRVLFKNCNFIAKRKKLFYLSTDGVSNVDEKSKMINCNYYLFNNNIIDRDYAAVLRSYTIQNCIFYDKRIESLKKINFIIAERNNNLGGIKKVTSTENKFIFTTGPSDFKDFPLGNSPQ